MKNLFTNLNQGVDSSIVAAAAGLNRFFFFQTKSKWFQDYNIQGKVLHLIYSKMRGQRLGTLKTSIGAEEKLFKIYVYLNSTKIQFTAQTRHLVAIVDFDLPFSPFFHSQIK